MYIDEKVWYDDCAFVPPKTSFKGSLHSTIDVHYLTSVGHWLASSKDDITITIQSYYCYGA